MHPKRSTRPPRRGQRRKRRKSPLLGLLGFLFAAVVLNLTPGSDVMFTIASAIKGGVPAGIAAATGVALGSFVHVTLTTFGLAALLAKLPWVFQVIKWGGVFYLSLLAYQAWTATAPNNTADTGRASYWRALKQGCITNVTNPKVALFILAFLPQFADETRGQIWAQMLILGMVFTLSGWVITSLYGMFAGYLGHKLRQYFTILNKLSAIILGGLALRLAAT